MEQTLSLQSLMKHFQERWSTLPDSRKLNNNTKYTIADGVLSAFAVFFMQSSSFLAHQRLLQSKKGRNNARTLFQVTEIPSNAQIRNLVDPLAHAAFAEDFGYVLDELKREQQLERFRNDLQTYAIALDGVNFFSSEKIACTQCLKRTDRNGSDALSVNWFELVIADEKTGESLYQNSFVTNHPVTVAHVAALAQVGRARWKIENENNNTLKTKGYHFEHNFGHGSQDLANVLATLNLLAFLLHTVQELLTPAYQRLRQALGTRTTFFNDLRTLTRYMVFDSWDDLFRFMQDGLVITPFPP
jgi:hypothetical protein